jgi:hypothetical protein
VEEPVREDNDDEQEDDDIETDSTQMDGPRTRSRDRTDQLKDTTGAFWIHTAQSECFDEEQTMYIVEVPVAQHGLPKVIDAKNKEFDNLKRFNPTKDGVWETLIGMGGGTKCPP